MANHNQLPATQSDREPMPITQADVGTIQDLLQDVDSGTNTSDVSDVFESFASRVKVSELFSGGHTIPGTDEWIPGQVEKRYSCVVVDGSGAQKVISLEPVFAARVLAYKKPTKNEAGQPANTTDADQSNSKSTKSKQAKPASGPAPKTATSGVSTKRDGIKDLVHLDARGRAHYDSGVRLAGPRAFDEDEHLPDGHKDKRWHQREAIGKLAGRFMTKFELDEIEKFQDEIRSAEEEYMRLKQAAEAGQSGENNNPPKAEVIATYPDGTVKEFATLTEYYAYDEATFPNGKLKGEEPVMEISKKANDLFNDELFCEEYGISIEEYDRMTDVEIKDLIKRGPVASSAIPPTGIRGGNVPPTPPVQSPQPGNTGNQQPDFRSGLIDIFGFDPQSVVNLTEEQNQHLLNCVGELGRASRGDLAKELADELEAVGLGNSTYDAYLQKADLLMQQIASQGANGNNVPPTPSVPPARPNSNGNQQPVNDYKEKLTQVFGLTNEEALNITEPQYRGFTEALEQLGTANRMDLAQQLRDDLQRLGAGGIEQDEYFRKVQAVLQEVNPQGAAAGNTAPATPEPSAANTQTGQFGRWDRVKNWVHLKRMDFNEWIKKPESKVQVAIGAVAVGVIGFAFSKGFISHDDIASAAPVDVQPDAAPPTPLDTGMKDAFRRGVDGNYGNAGAPVMPQPESIPAPEPVSIPAPVEVAPLQFEVNAGQTPWGVLENAGVPPEVIMQRLDEAAQASGLPYEWHGSGMGRWLEVNGQSDTQSIINMLGRYIKD